MEKQDRLTQEQIWDAIASSWQEFKKTSFPDVKEFLIGRKGRILDLGCGSGRNFSAMPKDAEIYGLDFSAEMLGYAEKQAKELGLKAFLSKANAASLQFKDGFFDAAICVATLHCIDSQEKREQALKELFRVLKPKAQAFITLWSKNHKRINGKAQEQIINWKKDCIDYPRYYYIYDKEEIEELLKKTGFKILSSKEDDNIVIEIEK